jgi:hypothetical protein
MMDVMKCFVNQRDVSDQMKSHLPPPSSILTLSLNHFFCQNQREREEEREGEEEREREKREKEKKRKQQREGEGEGERGKGERERRVKFSDIFCVGICFCCNQLTDTLTVTIP